MMKLKKISYKLHLWLGVPAAVIILLICLSGSVFVFADEIIGFANRDFTKVTPQGKQIPLDEMITIVKHEYPQQIALHSISYKAKNKSTLFVVASKASGMRFVYVNPYNGQIIGESRTIMFFSIIAHFHKQLLLGKTGSWIVLISSAIFLIELITGLILWRPKNPNRKYFKTSLSVKPNSSSLRRYIDLHRIFGLYFILIMLIVSVSGVALFFLPKHGIEAENHQSKNIVVDSLSKPLPLASLLNILMEEQSADVVKTELWNMDNTNEIQFIEGQRIGVISFDGTPFFINKYTGKISTESSVINKIKIRNTFRKLHVGDWLGWFGKTITLLTSLVGVFLSVTGLIIWQKKRNRQKKNPTS